jgi:hypothetical protein
VPAARRIIEDKRLKAGLVYDASKLNKSRISVAWVSANTWGLGSIYGTVEFEFAWSDLVAGQKIYWVEAMNYRPTAYRLLLSKRSEPLKSLASEALLFLIVRSLWPEQHSQRSRLRLE